jgi:hypothetical protein
MFDYAGLWYGDWQGKTNYTTKAAGTANSNLAQSAYNIATNASTNATAAQITANAAVTQVQGGAIATAASNAQTTANAAMPVTGTNFTGNVQQANGTFTFYDNKHLAWGAHQDSTNYMYSAGGAWHFYWGGSEVMNANASQIGVLGFIFHGTYLDGQGNTQSNTVFDSSDTFPMTTTVNSNTAAVAALQSITNNAAQIICTPSNNIAGTNWWSYCVVTSTVTFYPPAVPGLYQTAVYEIDLPPPLTNSVGVYTDSVAKCASGFPLLSSATVGSTLFLVKNAGVSNWVWSATSNIISQ